MGADIRRGITTEITGPNRLRAPASEMHCRASGTTLRIFTALSALADGRCVLTGDKTLSRRPIKHLVSGLRQLGVNAKSINSNGRPPVEVHGGLLRGGSVRIRGDVSSQYISGLLFACSKAVGDTTLEITTELASKPYVELTLETMAHFGVYSEAADNWKYIHMPGNQEYHSDEFDVEGDYSSAAFLMVAGALGGNVRVTGLKRDSKQGDAHIINILNEMGASVRNTGRSISTGLSELRALAIDVSQTPDIVPVLTLAATQAHGTTRIYNAARLRYKESNRLASISIELRKMGANISINDDGLEIRGPTTLKGATLDSHNDHRIAMTCILAGMIADGNTVVEGVECISKSYPNFIRDIQTLGGRIELANNYTLSGGKI